MDDNTRYVLTALLELSICRGSRQFRTPIQGLLLRSGLRESEDKELDKILNSLRDEEKAIDVWTFEDGFFQFVISSNQKIPSVDLSTKEIVCDRMIRRSLLYKLYEEYRKSGSIHARFPLGKLENILEISKEEILGHVDYLDKEYYLEYKLIDGGMSTSYLSQTGLKLCEIKADLFRTFGTVQVESKPAEEERVELDEDAKRRVFVVHGRNEKARRALFSFLRAVGLEPIEWSEAIHYTGSGSPYIGEILDHAFKSAQAVIVLITGDDIARLSSQFLKGDDPPYEREFVPQARPNVLFEAGLAFGRHSDRTILVELGQNRPFSDVAGRHVLRLGNDAKSRQDLVTLLKTVGCTVKTDGKTDWIHEGNFDAALATPLENVNKEIEEIRKVSVSANKMLEKDLNNILKFLAENQEYAFGTIDLMQITDLSMLKVQYHLDKLLASGYIKDVGGVYTLSEEGRAYLVEVLKL